MENEFESGAEPSTDAAAAAVPPKKGLITAILGPLNSKNALSWLFIIVLVLGIRWLLFENYTIPTGSMEPTLHGDMRWLRGDRVAVNKFIYGPRAPFTHTRLCHLWRPQRWEIVVFKAVGPDSEHGTLVKRIVGLPGERIHIRDGKILVNGHPVEPPPELQGILNYTTVLGTDLADVHLFALKLAAENLQDPDLNPRNKGVRDLYGELAELRERLNGADPEKMDKKAAEEHFSSLSKVSQDILIELYVRKVSAKYPLRYGILPDDEFSVVPPDCYLVCGDNSLDSADGRVFGWLPEGHILGRVSCIWWPVPRWRDFTGFSKTWWGFALLYGTPGLLAALELRAYLRRRNARKSAVTNT